MMMDRLVMTLGSLILLASCNGTISKQSSLDASSLGIGTGSATEQQALAILSTNCVSCHGGGNSSGGVSNITDVASLLQAGLIIPGQPNQSPLILAVQLGRMPLGGALSVQDIQTLVDWVSGSNSSPVANPVPAAGSNPAPVDTSTLAGQAITILQNNCYACHGTVVSGNVDQINNPAHLIALGVVIPGNAAGSSLYVAVSTGVMPLGGALSAADIATLANWINAGAQAPNSATTPAAPTVIPLGPSFQSLMQNVIGPKCLACHAGTTAKGGVLLDSYAHVLNRLTPYNVSSSDIYDVTKNGEMPQSPYPRLTSAELAALSGWIQAGALNN